MILVSRVGTDQYDAPNAGSVASATQTVAESLLSALVAASRVDGRSALNEATLLSLRHDGLRGKALWVAHEEGDGLVGFALADADPDATGRDRSRAGNPSEGDGAAEASGALGAGGAVEAAGAVEVNLLVVPEARRAGAGRALAETVLEAFPDAEITAWSHGNHPGAARLAESLGFARVRDLWVMCRPLSPEHPLPDVGPAGGVVVRTFRPGQDEEAFLALNAEAFAGHPEQGSMTRADLDQRMAEPWFDPQGFFLAEPADAPPGEANESVDSPSLLAFHWTKVHQDEEPPVGEVYVVGVSPAAQGQGLGRLLTLTGLHHLRDRGLGEVILYVEADNEAAIRTYSGLGFTHADEDTDVQYVRRASRT